MAGFDIDILGESLHKGRPKDEEPHVKRGPAKKGNDGIEYIVRIDLEELGILEDEFEELQCLFQLFDRDKDGVLNIREFQAIVKCLGLHLKIEKATELAGSVTCDNTGFSVSFNEFLKIVSNERKSQPDEMSLMDMFRSLDLDDKGYVGEEDFRNMLKGKPGITPEDVEEMITEYKGFEKKTEVTQDTEEAEAVIYYKDFVAMLQS